MTWHRQIGKRSVNGAETLSGSFSLWRYLGWDAHSGSRLLVWRLLPCGPVRLARHLLRFWYALRSETRSLRGRICTLLATKYWWVDFGSLGARLPDGRLIPNARTEARSLGTQELLSRYPWASNTDMAIFLEGFRAGEQFARRTEGIDLGIEVHASVASFPSCTSGAQQSYAAPSSSATDQM
jgi:hypothetical protein